MVIQDSDNMTFRSMVRIFDTTGGTRGKMLSSGQNATLLPGRISALEKIFNPSTIDPNVHHTMNKIVSDPDFIQTTNVSVDIASVPVDDASLSVATMNARTNEYFCIGAGGLNLAPLSVSKARSYENRLYKQIPFRFIRVGEVIPPEVTANYRFKVKVIVTKNGESVPYWAWYLKRFEMVRESVSEINVTRSNGIEYTPETEHSNPVFPGSADLHPLNKDSVECFVNFNLNIDSEDFKEYYIAVNGSLDMNAYVTEMGTVLANEDNGELKNVELFSKMTYAPTYMNKQENSLLISYQIFT